MIYNKLVRDRIPEIIIKSGKKLSFRTLDGDELKQALKDKLVEEAQELAKTKTMEQLIEEMADVYEVFDALCEIHKIERNDLLIEVLNKGAGRGRFLKGYFLESVEDNEDASNK